MDELIQKYITSLITSLTHHDIQAPSLLCFSRYGTHPGLTCPAVLEPESKKFIILLQINCFNFEKHLVYIFQYMD